MSWTLVNNTSYFTLTESGGEVHNIYSTDIRQLYRRGEHVWIVYSLREETVISNPTYPHAVNTLKLLYSDFTSPTYASAALLEAGLLAIIATMSTSGVLLSILAGIEDLSDGFHNLIGKPNGGDFVTSYNDGTSLDCDSMPDTHAVLITEDIEKVVQINTSSEVVEMYLPNEVAMVVTNPVGSTYRITIASATFAATDSFIVYTNVSVNRLTVKTLGTDTYTEAVTKGNIIGAVRNDAGTSLVDTDQEFAPLMVNATGMLNVNLDQVRDTAPEIGAGNAGGGTLRVSISTDDVNLLIIGGDTTSIDGKTPALGTGVMAGSPPITLATDDTQFGAVGAASDVDGNIHGQLRYIGETVNSWTGGTLPSTINVETNTAVGTSSEQLTAVSAACKRVVVTAHHANTGRLTIGESGVTDGYGIILYAADSIELFIDNINKLYVVSSVDAEDVSVTYFN